MELTRIKNKDINSQYIFKKQIKHAAFFDENIYLHIILFAYYCNSSITLKILSLI
jgi:hypothetical protein